MLYRFLQSLWYGKSYNTVLQTDKQWMERQCLSAEVGIVISNEIIAHILWGYDLIVFSDTPTGLQKQWNGLLKFCSNNKIIVNELKTKSMCFGTDKNLNVFFSGKPIEQVNQYKYLGYRSIY